MMHVQSKYLPKHKPLSLPIKKRALKNDVNYSTPSSKGIVIEDLSKSIEKDVDLAIHAASKYVGRGEGKMLFAATHIFDESSDDEAPVHIPLVYSSGVERVSERVEGTDVLVPPFTQSVPTQSVCILSPNRC